jgi:hypothetical protein
VTQGGSGQYLWTVAVVRVQPSYEKIGREAPPRALDVQVSAGGGGGGGGPTAAPP